MKTEPPTTPEQLKTARLKAPRALQSKPQAQRAAHPQRSKATPARTSPPPCPNGAAPDGAAERWTYGWSSPPQE